MHMQTIVELENCAVHLMINQFELCNNLIIIFMQLMLDSWNQSIFSTIKQRLQDSAMKLVHAERNGEAFDSQLVIGVRESYGMFTKNAF